MAYYVPYAKGWRAHVAITGFPRKSESFRTKREAVAWATALELEYRNSKSEHPTHTLSQALTRYSEEVSPTKRGMRWEQIRIAAFLRSTLPLSKPISQVSPEDIALWRDERLKVVGNGTVLREISLLSAIFEHARREWRWTPANPVADVRKPRQPDHRDVTLTRTQIRQMLTQLGYSPLRPVRSVSQSVAVAMLLALRTGMRAGELCRLEWRLVYPGYCTLPVTKTTPRDVPLTPKAERIIAKMRGFDPVTVFGVTPQTLDTLFRRARDRAGLAGFVFHDCRHTAATWLALKVDPLTLCKIFGWKQTTQALTYFNPKAADIAKRLA